MGFGKKDSRTNDLRKLMIFAATQLYERELATSGRPLTYDEIVSLITHASRRQKMDLSDTEFQSVLSGAVKLAKNRQYVGEISNRWSKDGNSLNYDDFRKAEALLDEDNQRNMIRGSRS